MRLAPAVVLLSALGLAACETPREACLSRAQRDLRVVESLIRETQGNLERGYGIEVEQEFHEFTHFCVDHDHDHDHDGHDDHDLELCTRTVVRDVERPIAINPAEERAKLDALLERVRRVVVDAPLGPGDEVGLDVDPGDSVTVTVETDEPARLRSRTGPLDVTPNGRTVRWWLGTDHRRPPRIAAMSGHVTVRSAVVVAPGSPT